MKAFARRIKLLRIKQNLTQSQLAERSGIKREYISRLERGLLKNPTLNTLKKLANGLEVPMESLMITIDSSHSLDDLLKQSGEIEQKIGSLRADAHRLQELLRMVETNQNQHLLSEPEALPAKTLEQPFNSMIAIPA